MGRSTVDRSSKRVVSVTRLSDVRGKDHPTYYKLVCRDCGNECSATPGDYWQHPEGATIRCSDCLEPMNLVVAVSISSHDGMLYGAGNLVIRTELTFQDLREIVPDIGR